MWYDSVMLACSGNTLLLELFRRYLMLKACKKKDMTGDIVNIKLSRNCEYVFLYIFVTL